MKIVKTLYLSAALLLLTLCAQAQQKTVWLDEAYRAALCVQDWGMPQQNQAVVWTPSPLTVNGTVYERGVGVHSISRMLFSLDKKALYVTGMVGADDNNPFAGKHRYKIVGDRKVLWQSPVMWKGMPVQPFHVDLTGVDKVLLLVEECGDGIMYDHADWLNVKFVTNGEVTPIPVWPKPVKKERYILTPPASGTPCINNPLVYGARPGNPFQMAIMASGERPMVFSAHGLPEGLELDESTGVITGVCHQRGEFKVRLVAENGLGRDEKEVTLRMGDKIALTPPMGWNSWNCWGLDVDDAKVRDAARTMHEKLQPYGWTYINVDDGWQAAERSSDGTLGGNAKFPDMKALGGYVHSLGLKFGIYSSPGPTTCGSFLGSYGHEETDARTWAEWGVDYLKYDHCGYMDVQKDTQEKTIQAPYIVMRDALDKMQRDVVFCVGYGAPNVWNWAKEAGGELWRTTRDITDEWNVVTAIGCFQDVCAQVTAPGSYNDPDMLVVGKLGKAWRSQIQESALTPDEQYSHISLWCILSAPLLIGCDLDSIDDFTLGLLTNSEVLAVNQDPLVYPAHKIMTDNGQIWYKRLYDGSYAVGLFQIDPYFVLWEQEEGEDIQLRDYTMQLCFDQIGINGQAHVRDLWRQKDLGVFHDNFSINVPWHGVSFLKVTPMTN